MGPWGLIGPAVAALVAMAGYGRLVALRSQVQHAWSQLEGQLQRRSDLIPRLIEAVKDSGPPESALLESVTRARQGALRARGIPARAEAENQLTQALHCLFTAAETDSGGQTDPDTRALQEELEDVENQILAAGQRYNHRVMALNIRTGRFPWSLISRPTGFRPVEYFVLDERPARQ